MTYCLAIKVHEGLVCLADGRLTSGTQVTQARKISRHGVAGSEVCIMTSGLRSLRDKTLAYFDRALEQSGPNGVGSLLDAVESYARCLRAVADEDRETLERSELSFNLPRQDDVMIFVLSCQFSLKLHITLSLIFHL